VEVAGAGLLAAGTILIAAARPYPGLVSWTPYWTP